MIDESVVLDDDVVQEIEQQNISFEQPEAEIHSFSATSSRQPFHSGPHVIRDSLGKFMSPKR